MPDDQSAFLAQQYELVKSARAVVFDFCAATLRPADFTCPVPTFNGSSIRYLLVHVADTYRGWLGAFGEGQPRQRLRPTLLADVAAVRALYQEQIDPLVSDFLAHFATCITAPLARALPTDGRVLTLTPLALFTHVITHEFHHKGQILSMARHMGYVPVDTDIIRLE